MTSDVEEWLRELDGGDRATLRVGEYEYGGVEEIADFDVSGVDEIEVEVIDVDGEIEILGKPEVEGYRLIVALNDDVTDEMGAEAPAGKLEVNDVKPYELTLVVTADVDSVSATPAELEVWPVELMDSAAGVAAEAEEYREPALSAADQLGGRQKSMARAVLADAVVSYVAEEGVGDVWGEYSEEADEASVSEFVEWLSAREFADLLDERGGEVFPEREEMLDVSQRTARDALVALRHFRRQE